MRAGSDSPLEGSSPVVTSKPRSLPHQIPRKQEIGESEPLWWNSSDSLLWMSRGVAGVSLSPKRWPDSSKEFFGLCCQVPVQLCDCVVGHLADLREQKRSLVTETCKLHWEIMTETKFLWTECHPGTKKCVLNNSQAREMRLFPFQIRKTRQTIYSGCTVRKP